MSDDIVQEAIKSLEDWDTCYSQNEEMRDAALAALKVQADVIELLRAENEKLRDALSKAAGELQHAYIMGFTERYRDAAISARSAAAAIRETE